MAPMLCVASLVVRRRILNGAQKGPPSQRVGRGGPLEYRLSESLTQNTLAFVEEDTLEIHF